MFWNRDTATTCRPNRTFIDGGTSYQCIGGVDLALVEVIESPERPAARLADEATTE
jgi:hypothetical protein